MLATAILHACGTGTTTTTSAIGGSGGASSGLPAGDVLGAVAVYGIATAILAAGILTLVAIVLLSRRADPAPVAVPIGATLSPDGYYWWDGASWRPTR